MKIYKEELRFTVLKSKETRTNERNLGQKLVFPLLDVE
jgi:hypothetical protein